MISLPIVVGAAAVMLVLAAIEQDATEPGTPQQLRIAKRAGADEATAASSSLADDWQAGLVGKKLAPSDVRSPLVRDIAVERCLAILRAFPDLDELQLISREGTAWRRDHFNDYAAGVRAHPRALWAARRHF